MALKNYTSTVSVLRSIAYIESKLTQNGARQILKEYGPTGKVDCICFTIPLQGKDVHFKLAARIAQCEEVLKQNLSSRVKPETRKKLPAQAERTAWKIISDLVEVQMAMIELKQREVMEIFLPYVYNCETKQTFFEQIKERKFKALLPASKE